MNRQKKRHGCLRVWLVFMLVSNLTAVLIYMFGNMARGNYPNAPIWAFPVLIVVGIVNIVLIFALFQWRKWGFWGSLITSIVAFVVNLLIGVSFVQALYGLSGIVILFGVLQIGGKNKGWPQLN